MEEKELTTTEELDNIEDNEADYIEEDYLDLMLVYDAVETKLGSDYANVFHQSAREDEVGDVGIYLYESANDVEDMAGNEVYNCIKVQVQVNAENNKASIRKAIKYLTRFTKRIENETSYIPGINFVSAQHIGPRAYPLGKNEYNIFICRSVIDLKYTYETENSLIRL